MQRLGAVDIANFARSFRLAKRTALYLALVVSSKLLALFAEPTLRAMMGTAEDSDHGAHNALFILYSTHPAHVL